MIRYALSAVAFLAALTPNSANGQIDAQLVADVEAIHPGQTFQVGFRFDVTKGYYTYHQEPGDIGLKPKLSIEPPSGFVVGDLRWPAFERKTGEIEGQPYTQNVYKRDFAVAAEVTAPESLEPGSTVVFEAKTRFQFCEVDGPCILGGGKSTLELPIVASAAEIRPSEHAELLAAVGVSGDGPVAAGAPADEFRPVDREDVGGSLWFFLGSAFVGGVILNIMPCVLPVIAIKLLSFAQQAGESRGRMFVLNLVYSVGVISVFLALATLAVVAGLGWGGLFQRPEFNLFMAALVFAMGLSLLGVFEIPLPGMVGSVAASGEHREGLVGAFFTGVLATLLATPCSGPFLGITLGWSVQQPAYITYLVWFVMGLGMAFPYLIVGIFPKLVSWIPKPGMWMVRFKEIAGFVLMGTVIFLISVLDPTYVVPLLVILLGLSLGLWMVGNLYDVTSSARQKTTVRVIATGVTMGICSFGVFLTLDRDVELAWQDFSEAKLEQSLASNETVLVDFTADWCLTCKLNESRALNRRETKAVVEELGVVTLYADYTNEDPEIKRWLDRFDSISVPLTVIFPGSDPNRPIVLRDVFGKSDVIEALREAGPSKRLAGTARMAKARTSSPR